VKSKQRYKSSSGAREKNVNLHTKVVNVVVGNDSKLSFLGGCVVAPNSGSDKEDSLEGENLVND